MKVTSVEIHPQGSSDIHVLSYRDPRRLNPYNVVKITGLDADSIVPQFYGTSGNSEDKFYNPTLESRSIVMRVQLNPNFSLGATYSSLRDAIYRSIASSRTGLVQLQFKNEAAVTAAISGFVKKIEAGQFERNQEVQITIETERAFLQALTPTSLSVVGLNPADTNIQDLLSTAQHGFRFSMTFVANLATFTLTNVGDTSWSFAVTPAGGFLTGDVLHFSSEFDDLELYLVRSAVTTHVADKIVPGSVWPILFPGDNHFSVASPASMNWTTISHYPTYWGV